LPPFLKAFFRKTDTAALIVICRIPIPYIFSGQSPKDYIEKDYNKLKFMREKSLIKKYEMRGQGRTQGVNPTQKRHKKTARDLPGLNHVLFFFSFFTLFF
jgi:hypothetical protein